MARVDAQVAIAHPSSLKASALSGITLPWLVRALLAGCFLMAFLQYELHSEVGQFIHLAFLFAAALVVLSGPERRVRIQGLFGAGALLWAGVLFSEAISYISGDRYSMTYGLVFIAVVAAARLIVIEIGIPNVLRAYSQAAMLTVAILLFTGQQSLREGTNRFNGGANVHPNLVAFILGGFFCVVVWRALEYKVRWKRRLAAFLAVLNFIFIFDAGSRGTLGGLLVAGFVIAGRRMLAGRWVGRMRIRHWHVIGVAIALPLMVAYLVQHARLEHFLDFLDTSLDLTSTQRGLNSGLSGRTGIWQIAFRLLAEQNRWIFGFGYRAGDRLVGTLDNGYVQLLFDSGLLAGSMILGSMLRVFVVVWRASRPGENTPWSRYYTTLCALMIVYLLNNISARYLFSFGSSFSLLIILLVTASRRDLEDVKSPVRVRPRTAEPLARPGEMAWSAPER